MKKDAENDKRYNSKKFSESSRKLTSKSIRQGKVEGVRGGM